MDLSRFVTAKYWFDLAPNTEIHNFKTWLILFCAIAIIGGLTLANRFLFKKIRNKTGYFLLTIGILGLLFLSFRYEGVYFLSSRLFFLALAIVALIWIINILIYLVKTYPKEIKEIADYKKFNSYLPKKKK